MSIDNNNFWERVERNNRKRIKNAERLKEAIKLCQNENTKCLSLEAEVLYKMLHNYDILDIFRLRFDDIEKTYSDSLEEAENWNRRVTELEHRVKNYLKKIKKSFDEIDQIYDEKY